MKRIFKISLFYKMLFVFLLVIIPVFFCAYLINQKGTASLLTEISNSFQHKTEFYLGSLEEEISQIVRLQNEYLLDRDLMELSTVYNGMTFDKRRIAMLNLQHKLHLLKSSSSYVKEAKAHIVEIDRVIASAAIDSGIDREFYEVVTARKQDPGNESMIIPYNGQLYLTMQYPSPLYSENPIYLLTVELDQSYITKGLKAAIGNHYGGATLRSRDMEWIIEAGQSTGFSGNSDPEEGKLATPSTVYSFESKEEVYLAAQMHSGLLKASLLLYAPRDEILGPIIKYNRWFWLLTGVSVIIVLFFAYSMYRMVHRPLQKLVQAFRDMSRGNMNTKVSYVRDDEFGYLYRWFNSMTDKLNQLIEEVFQQKIRNQRSELKRLQSQINPHFLYNSLFLLYRLIKGYDNENAYMLAKHLGDYFQFVTRDTNDTIRLQLEAEHARSYIQIQTACFGQRINVRFGALSAGCETLMVPRLILQPIVENAYKYALEQKSAGGELLIGMEAEEEPRLIRICIEDNGDTITDQQIEGLNGSMKIDDELEEVTGLLNVHRRIQFHYGKESGLAFSRSRLGGLKVSLTLDLEAVQHV